MIVVKEYTNNNNPSKWDATLYADTKAEVTTANVDAALPDYVTLEPGSVVFTASLDTAVYKSDGTWAWL